MNIKNIFSLGVQKILSFVVSISFIVPIFLPWSELSVFSATRETEYSLVAILVDDLLYSLGNENDEGSITGKVHRYAQEVQQKLPKTKTLILPVDTSRSTEHIHRVLENLYLEGQVRDTDRFFLEGIVLVGDIELPQISSGGQTIPSIFPYTDFVSPVFLWDTQIQRWIENPVFSLPTAEIWHGLITGTEEQISDYFDKNHQTYISLLSSPINYSDEKVLFWDTLAERDSVQPLYLGQNEMRNAVVDERKSYRYNKKFLEQLYGEYLDADVFKKDDVEIYENLFPAGEKIFLDSVENITDIFREEFWDDSPDRYTKRNIDDTLPIYAKVAEAYETQVQELIDNTGRWSKENLDSIPKMISIFDEYTANEIEKIKTVREQEILSTFGTSDSQVRFANTGFVEALGLDNEGELQRSVAPAANYYNGVIASNIVKPQDCTLYRGTFGYNYPYESIEYTKWLDEKRIDIISDDRDVLYNADPLPSLDSQQVEFNMLYDASALLGVGDPRPMCDAMGGCCILNAQTPEKCNPKDATEPLFSWAGGHTVKVPAEVRDGNAENNNHISAQWCKKFNFTQTTLQNTQFDSIKGSPTVYGPIEYRSINSVQDNKHPSQEGEQSLQNIVSNPLSKAIATNRTPYTDLLVGYPEDQVLSSQDYPNAFVYQYKDSDVTLRNIYEMGQADYQSLLALVGGNTVYNRNTQPKESTGFTSQTASIKLQRIVQFTPENEMIVSRSYPIPDDKGKTPIDYEYEIVQSAISQFGALDFGGVQGFLKDKMRDATLPKRAAILERDESLIKDYINNEINGLVRHSWESKLLSSLSLDPTLLGSITQKKNESDASEFGISINPQEYYLSPEILKNSEIVVPTLDAYLLPKNQFSSGQFNDKYWTWTNLKENKEVVSWLSDEQKEEIENMEGEVFLEVYEIMAGGDDVWNEHVGITGKSFLGLRENSENPSPFYAEVTGQTTNINFRTDEITYENPSATQRGGADEGGGGNGSKECEDKIISDEMFYEQNIIDANTCEEIFLLDTVSSVGSLPNPDEFQNKVLETYTPEELDFLLDWKDMTSAEKHERIQDVLFDADQKDLPLQRDPYVYAHLNMEGEFAPIWRGEDAQYSFENINLGDQYFPEPVPENPDIDQDTTCGPIEGVPLHQWISAISCWLREMQKNGIDWKAQCVLSIEKFQKNMNEFAVEPTQVSIESFSDPLLKGQENQISIQFTNDEGIPSRGKRVEFTVLVEGAEFSNIVPDLDTTVDGAQLDDADGEESIRIIPTDAFVTITVQALYNGKTFEATKTFTSSVTAGIDFELISEEEVGETSFYTFKLVLNDFAHFEYPITLNSTSQLQTVFSSRSVEIDEEFSVAVRTDKQIDITASVMGTKSAVYSLNGSSEAQDTINMIHLPDLPKDINFYETLEIPIIFINPLGSQIDGDQIPTVSVDNSESVYMEIIEKEGTPYLKIENYNSTGIVDFALSIDSGADSFSYFSGAKKSREEYQDYNFNALYATITGIDDYGPSIEEHFANIILHSSDSLNTVTTQIVAPKMKAPLFQILENGSIQAFSSSIIPELSSASPLKVQVFDETDMKFKGTFEYDGSSITSLFLKQPEYEQSGIFVENYDQGETLQIEKTSDITADIIVNGNKVGTISPLGVNMTDAYFTLEIDDNEISNGFSLFLGDNQGTPHVKITYRGGMFKEEGDSLFTSQSSQSPNHYILTDPNAPDVQYFEDFQSDFSRNEMGAGLEGEQTYVLEYASGIEVGPATQSSADIFMINFGDPTFSLSPPPEYYSSGFNTTVGESIVTDKTGQIKHTFPFHFDTDGKQDIAVVKSSGAVEILTSQGNGKFKNWNTGIIINPEYRMLSVFDKNNDGAEDILYADEVGVLHFISNTDQVLEFVTDPEELSFLPDIKIMSGELKDMDNDGRKDLAIISTSGAMEVYYGNDSGFDEPKVLEEFSFSLPSDMHEGILISFDGIEDIESIKDYLLPLSYFSPTGSIEDITNVFVDEPVSNATLDSQLNQIINSPSSATFSTEVSSVNEQYFAPLSLFSASFSPITKTGSVRNLDEDGTSDSENTDLDTKLVDMQISLTSINPDPLTITLADPYSSLLKIQPRTITCSQCGDEFESPLLPSTSKTIVFENITINPGETVDISYNALVKSLPPTSLRLSHLNDDDIVDITLENEGEKAHYGSNSPREYARFTPDKAGADIPSFLQNLEDADGNGIPDTFEIDENNNNIPDYIEGTLNDDASDSDGDRVPGFWDDGTELGFNVGNVEGLENLENFFDEAIDLLTSCKTGGCLNLPINYAFLVPGKPNLIAPLLATTSDTGLDAVDDYLSGVTDTINSELQSVIDKVGLPSGTQPYVMTVFNYGPTHNCIGRTCIDYTGFFPKPIPYALGFARSTFRFYLSPTLTGGVGIVTCYGPGVSTTSPGGKCFIQAVPNEILGDFCEQLLGIQSHASNSHSSLGGGQTLFTVESGYNDSTDGELLQFSLANIDSSIPTVQNTRVNGGPSFFARWANRQIEEFSALFSLPHLTIYYPDLPGTLFNNTQGGDILSAFYNKSDITEAKEDFTEHLSDQGFEKWWKNMQEQDRSQDSSVEAGNPGTGADEIKQKHTGVVDEIYNRIDSSKFLKKTEYRAKTIDDFYRMVESIPLIQMSRKPITLKYPSLSRKEILSAQADWTSFKEHAKSERERFLQDIEDLPADEKVEAQKILKDFDNFLEDGEKFYESLEFYKELGPQMLSDLDAEISQYLYSVICYIDAISDLIGGWTLRNKIRYEKWLELFDTLPAIMKAFQTLPEIFNSYQGYCETCRASNYDSGSFVVNVLGNFLPEPPIVKFPRFPDIVLDLSQINAAIVVEIPQLKIKPVQIKLPSLPDVYLPSSPRAGLNLKYPKFPTLPTFEIPELPPFPEIPIPKIPDIPPPPIIPSFMADFGNLMKVIEKGLYLYCLIIRKGIFVYPEGQSMAVVETLTQRPVSNPLSIDFLSLKFPSISLPSISEIIVTAEVNLEMDLDTLSEPVQEFAKELNGKTTDFVNIVPDPFEKYTDILDQSGLGDNIQQEINEGTRDIQKEFNEGSRDLTNEGQEGSDDIQNKSDDATNDAEEDLNTDDGPLGLGMTLWKTLMQKEKELIEKQWSEKSDQTLSVSELRKELGLPVWRAPKSLHSTQAEVIGKYDDLKQELIALQEYHEQQQQFIASDDIHKLFDQEDIPQKIFALEADESQEYDNVIPDITPHIPATSQSPSGFFYTDESGAVVPLRDYKDDNDSIHSFFFYDANEDGKEDIIYATPFSVRVKIRDELNSPSTIDAEFDGVPEIGVFDSFLPAFHSPQNISISQGGERMSFSIFPEPLSSVSGIVYELDERITEYHRGNFDSSRFIIQLSRELYDEVSSRYDTEEWFLPNQDIIVDGLVIANTQGKDVYISPMDSEIESFSPEYGKIYSLRAKWITTDNTLSTVSTHDIVLNSPSTDITPPFSMESENEQAYLYKENIIPLSGVYDSENQIELIQWDENLDGIYEITADEYTSPIFRMPTEQTLLYRVEDSAQNEIEDQKHVSYIAPDILLENAMETEVRGNTFPRYANVPATILRDRSGITKKIGMSETNDSGVYVLDNLNTSSDIIIKDQSGKEIGKMNAATNTLISLSSDYSVQIIPGDGTNTLRQVLVDTDGNIIANTLIYTDDFASVQSLENTQDFSDMIFNGMYIKDINLDDEFTSGSLPYNAPDNPGGQNIYNATTSIPLVHVYRNGNIRFFPDQPLSLRTFPNDDSSDLIIEILHNGIPIFHAFPKIDGEEEDTLVINLEKSLSGLVEPITSRIEKLSSYFIAAAEDNISSFSTSFTDIEKNHQAYTALQNLFNENLIIGYSDNTFKPDEKITRAEFVHLALAITTCLDCLAPSQAEKERFYTPYSFPDIAIEAWYEFCVSKAKKLGMIQGYGDGLYYPEENISKAEAVAILLRQAQIPLEPQVDVPVGDLYVEAWYYKYMATALNLGVIESSLGFSFPDKKITRGDFAMMASKLHSLSSCKAQDSDGDGIFDYIEIYNGTDEFSSGDNGDNSQNFKDLYDPRFDVLRPIPLDSDSDNNNNNDQDNNEGTDNNGNNTDSNLDKNKDSDSDGIPDSRDLDSNNPDMNSDGIRDGFDTDGDGLINLYDPNDNNSDIDNDGILDGKDTDIDGDGINNKDDENNASSENSGDNDNNPKRIDFLHDILNDPEQTFTDENIPLEEDEIDDENKSEDDDETPETKTDICLFVPEDIDGIDDEDGCPEIDNGKTPNDSDTPKGPLIEVVKGDSELCGFIEYVADIRPGDIVWSAIISDDGTEVYSKSKLWEIGK